MGDDSWKWKSKDGCSGGLLYEPGNWGDLLKIAWLLSVAEWKQSEDKALLTYFDPFAGQAGYPLGRSTLSRFRQAGMETLHSLEPYIEKNLWPSAALLMLDGGAKTTVFDTDPHRLHSWIDSGAMIVDAESGWAAIQKRDPCSDSLWLVDPYDFLAEWRDVLPMVVELSRTVTILLYIYNRSAGKHEHFTEYRAFRNRLDDALDGRPRCFGRATSDPFLPRAHHEMLLLPSPGDADSASYPRLTARLEQCTAGIAAALTRAALFDNI